MAQGEHPATPSPDRRWRGDQASHAPGAGRRNLALKLAAMALALTAIVAGLLTYLKPTTKPYVLSIPVREYKNVLYPVNAFAEQDCQALTACFPEKKLTNAAFNSQIKELIDGELRNLRDRADRPVVVHLTCLATVRRGEVFLLPADAQPDQPGSWLALSQVLDRLVACPAPAKLLLLDIAHPVVDGRLGVLCDYLMEEVDKVLTSRDLKSLYVLCSCSAGQVSLTSEELRTSVFAHYVVQGLRGTADGCQDGTKDKRITVKELAAFVSDRTDRWAQQNRSQRQTPRLWGEGMDFTLVDFDDLPADTEPSKVEYPPWLRQGWSKRDEMLQANVQRFAPQVLRELEDDLLRRELRWRGGFEPATLAGEMQLLLAKESFKQLPKPVLLELPPRTLPLELARISTSAQAGLTPENLRDLRALFDKVPLADGKKEDAAKLKEQWLKTIAATKGVPAALWADELFNTLANLSQPQPQQLVFVQDAIQPLELGPKHIELIWLKRLTDFAGRVKDKDPQVWQWPAVQVRQSLRALRARETLIALAAKEPAHLANKDSWFDNGFRQAEKDRQKGDKLLLWDRPNQWPEALTLLQQAEGKYRDLHDSVGHWQSATAALEDAWAVLPGYVPYLALVPTSELEEKQWLQACGLAQKLGDFFLTAQAATAKLPVDGEVLAYQLSKFRIQTDAFAKLADHGDAADVAKAEALLASPRLDAARREALWNAARQLKLRLLERTLQFDQQSLTVAAKPAAVPTQPRAEDHWPAQIAQAQRSQRLTHGVLQIGVQGWDPAEKQWQQSPNKTDPRDYDDLADKLGQVWMRQLPDQFKNYKGVPARADRLGRILPLSELTLPNQGQLPLSVVQRQEGQRDFKRWLAARFDDEADFLHAPGSQESSEVSDFFREAARDFRR